MTVEGSGPFQGRRRSAAYDLAVDSPPDETVEVEAGDTIWRFDRAFLSSNWTCIWGRGCLGIRPEPAEHLAQGCCSVGADLDGLDEARLIDALAATLESELFQHHEHARTGGVFADSSRTSTRVVGGACIFLNRPGFAGGAGCALHLAALAAGESPVDWKPSVCWQLPLKVEWEPGEDGREIATVRGWTRADWGAEGATMAWCCTEGDRAYVGDRPVVESLGAELEAIVGTSVYIELRRKLIPPAT
jgi:hypothetical protein